MFASIISVSFVVLAVLSVLPGILRARKRPWAEALVRIVLTAISAVVAVVMTSTLAFRLTDALVKPIETLLATFAEDIFAEVASAEATLLIILAIIVTPIFFIAVFFVTKALLSLLARPLTKLCLTVAGSISKKDLVNETYPKKSTDEDDSESQKPHFCVKSAICGAICGLLAYTVFLIPVVGTLETLSSIGMSVTDEGTVYEVSEAMSDNFATKLMHPIAAPVWSNFTHYTVNDEEIVLEDEAHLVAVLVDAMGEMSSSDENTIHHSAQIFRDLSELCPNTSLVPCLCADFINAASAHWLEGDDFNGIMMPTIAEDEDADVTATQDDIVATLVKCLDHSTTETMREDLATIANVMAVIAENATLDTDGKINLTTLFQDEIVIAKLSVELLKNERLAPVVSTLIKKQVETSDTKFDLPEKDGEVYNQIVDTIVDSYQENVGDTVSEEALENLSNAVGSTLEEQGIILEEHEKVAIASTLISEFGNGADLTSEKVADFIEFYRKEQE